MHMSSGHIKFDPINTISQHSVPDLLWRWLPDGQVKAGCWADFATGDGARAPILVASYLLELSCPETARKRAVALGLSNGGAAHG